MKQAWRERALNHGYLPRHYLSDAPRELILAYVDDYLKEEIAASDPWATPEFLRGPGRG